MPGPVAGQPVRSGRLTISAARRNVALFIHRAVRPLTRSDFGAPLRSRLGRTIFFQGIS